MKKYESGKEGLSNNDLRHFFALGVCMLGGGLLLLGAAVTVTSYNLHHPLRCLVSIVFSVALIYYGLLCMARSKWLQEMRKAEKFNEPAADTEEYL